MQYQVPYLGTWVLGYLTTELSHHPRLIALPSIYLPAARSSHVLTRGYICIQLDMWKVGDIPSLLPCTYVCIRKYYM